MAYSGRTGPNVSEYIANLNAIPSAADLPNDEEFNLDADLAMFTNTQFFDYDLGEDTDLQATSLRGDGQDGRAVAPDNVDMNSLEFMNGKHILFLLLFVYFLGTLYLCIVVLLYCCTFVPPASITGWSDVGRLASGPTSVSLLPSPIIPRYNRDYANTTMHSTLLLDSAQRVAGFWHPCGLCIALHPYTCTFRCSHRVFPARNRRLQFTDGWRNVT